MVGKAGNGAAQLSWYSDFDVLSTSLVQDVLSTSLVQDPRSLQLSFREKDRVWKYFLGLGVTLVTSCAGPPPLYFLSRCILAHEEGYMSADLGSMWDHLAGIPVPS